jgi:hypothetical protein
MIQFAQILPKMHKTSQTTFLVVNSLLVIRLCILVLTASKTDMESHLDCLRMRNVVPTWELLQICTNSLALSLMTIRCHFITRKLVYLVRIR